MSGKTAAIAQLRARIEALEQRPVLAERGSLSVPDSGHLFGGLPGRLLHEVWTDSPVEAGAGLGFALGQARGLLSAARPAILWLFCAHDAQERGLPYGPGLASSGFDPGALLIGRMKDMSDLLWAVEEAIACPAVAAVIAETGPEHRVLDFTATRRLHLRALGAGASVFLLRSGREREATAAPLRWHVSPAPSASDAYDRRAPGTARFQVRREKGQAGLGLRGRADWQVNWSGHGFAIDAGDGNRTGLSGPAPARLGDRLSQTA